MILETSANVAVKPTPVLRAQPVLSGADAGGIVAPWWEDVVIERVATADGQPLAFGMWAAYERLFDVLEDLTVDGEVERAAVEAAMRLLQRCMFSGAPAPKMTWHGGDAVVLFWTVAGVTSLFTVGAREISVLVERDGVITRRSDDLPLRAWEYLFPVPNGRY